MPLAQANIGTEVLTPVELVLSRVPHNAKEVLNELVPFRIPNINTLDPEQLQRSFEGAGRSALRSVKSFDVHELGGGNV
jgi:hypothetical protein